jgi:hypothetical protein
MFEFMYLIYSDEVTKSIENDSSSFQPTEPSQNGHHQTVSPKSSKKGAAPPPPKPPKLASVKIRQAPVINEMHCFNGTDDKSSTSPTQQTPPIHT